MKKRILGLVLCLMLLLPLAAPAARADETVFFTAMGESILPLRGLAEMQLHGSNAA